jgi:hypothetical protein
LGCHGISDKDDDDNDYDDDKSIGVATPDEHVVQVRWDTNRLLENPLRIAEIRLNPPGLL